MFNYPPSHQKKKQKQNKIHNDQYPIINYQVYKEAKKKMTKLRRKINQQTDSEMTKIAKFVDKVINPAVKIIFHMFKKVEKSISIIKRKFGSIKMI